MTSKVIVEAQSHDAEVRVLPVVNGEVLQWETLSEQTRKFAIHRVPKGETRDFIIHSGQSLLIVELVE